MGDHVYGGSGPKANLQERDSESEGVSLSEQLVSLHQFSSNYQIKPKFMKGLGTDCPPSPGGKRPCLLNAKPIFAYPEKKDIDKFPNSSGFKKIELGSFSTAKNTHNSKSQFQIGTEYSSGHPGKQAIGPHKSALEIQTKNPMPQSQRKPIIIMEGWESPTAHYKFP